MSKQTAQQKEQMKKLYDRNRNTQPTLIEDFDVKNLIFAFGNICLLYFNDFNILKSFPVPSIPIRVMLLKFIIVF